MEMEFSAFPQFPLPYEKLKNKKILITGATGLIGYNLIKALEEISDYYDQLFTIYIGARNIEKVKKLFPEIEQKKTVNYYFYDMCKTLETDIDFDLIFALAGNASPYHFSHEPVETMCNNYNALKNILDYLKERKSGRLVFVSTGEIYGQANGIKAFDEEYSGPIENLDARSCYPNSKRMCETLCAAYKEEYGVDFVVARPCHVYGSNSTNEDNRVYIQFLRNAIEGKNIIMKSKGTQIRSYCYVIDCVAELIYIAFKGECGQAYNVSNMDSVVSIKELANIIAKLAGTKVVFDIPNKEEIKGYNKVQCSVLSDNKIRSLGYVPKYSLEKGLYCTFLKMKESME